MRAGGLLGEGPLHRRRQLPGPPQELFIATSQKFVQETELSQRVRDWEVTLQPLLQEQVRGWASSG